MVRILANSVSDERGLVAILLAGPQRQTSAILTTAIRRFRRSQLPGTLYRPDTRAELLIKHLRMEKTIGPMQIRLIFHHKTNKNIFWTVSVLLDKSCQKQTFF